MSYKSRMSLSSIFRINALPVVRNGRTEERILGVSRRSVKGSYLVTGGPSSGSSFLGSSSSNPSKMCLGKGVMGLLYRGIPSWNKSSSTMVEGGGGDGGGAVDNVSLISSFSTTSGSCCVGALSAEYLNRQFRPVNRRSVGEARVRVGMRMRMEEIRFCMERNIEIVVPCLFFTHMYLHLHVWYGTRFTSD